MPKKRSLTQPDFVGKLQIASLKIWHIWAVLEIGQAIVDQIKIIPDFIAARTVMINFKANEIIFYFHKKLPSNYKARFMVSAINYMICYFLKLFKFMIVS